MSSRGRKGYRTSQMMDIAEERIDILFEAAESAAKEHDIVRSHRYVELARRIGMRYNLRIPSKHRPHFCRSCYAFLMPGVNATIRTRSSRVVTSCRECGRINRLPFHREVKERRSKGKE